MTLQKFIDEQKITISESQHQALGYVLARSYLAKYNLKAKKIRENGNLVNTYPPIFFELSVDFIVSFLQLMTV